MTFYLVVFFQAEDGIRDLVRSRGLGDVYKRQVPLVKGRPGDLFVRGKADLAPPGGLAVSGKTGAGLSLIHI